MKKSITKKAKRPKSVLKKAWETRRKKAAELVKLAQVVKEFWAEDDSPAKATPTSETETPRSEVDRVAFVLDLHRDEQLLAFMGDLAAGRQSGQQQGHYPFLVSRTQIDAIEDFLSLHGYSAWGKGSGALASVSTNPTAS